MYLMIAIFCQFDLRFLYWCTGICRCAINVCVGFCLGMGLFLSIYRLQVKTWKLSTEFEEYPVGGFDAGYGSLKLQNTSILFFS